MSVIKPISTPLPGERVLGLTPEDAAAAATDWLRRPNLFAGRALTAPTLEGRQRWQAGRVAQRGQAFSAGVVQGLETSFVIVPPEPPAGDYHVKVLVEPGQALAASGEDVVLLRRTEFDLYDVPTVAPPEWLIPEDEAPAPPAPNPGPAPGPLLPRVLAGPLLQVGLSAGTRWPLAGVLLLQPATVEVSGFDATSPCDRCPCGDGTGDPAGYEDTRTADAARLLFYPWPEEWLALPTDGAQRRNQLAHLIFSVEATLQPGEPLPWEAWGVPVGLFIYGDDWAMDRAAVVRKGGRAREARLRLGGPAALQANSRLPGLWQARIEQFAEHVASLGDPGPAPAELAERFASLPPCGLLPRSALDFTTYTSSFFPALQTVDAVPVPLEQLDVAMREAAPLAPIAMSAAERVRVLVPVPQASWEPRLLHPEVIDPDFQATLNRFLLRRARELGARQGVRNEIALLAQALTGQPQTVPAFDDDAQAVDVESLSPWGPPPPGGGHRSVLRDGVHQHYFEGATETLTPGTDESLFVWACLDPDHPPRTLMLQWAVGSDWEHRAYWGDDLIDWGTPDSASRLRVGDLPEAGRWVQLEVPAASLGLATQAISGMSFTLYDGNAAFGLSGSKTRNTYTKWFCNLLPAGARRLGDVGWDLLSHNDLWAPFETGRAVIPSVQARMPPGLAGHRIRPRETPVPAGQLEATLTFTGMLQGAARLTAAPSDALSCWVFVDPLNPPRHLMLLWYASTFDPFIMGGAYWGPSRLDAFASNRYVHMGALPMPGQWHRLEVPLQKLGVPANTGQTPLIDFMAFVLLPAGNVMFGAAGRVDAAGVEHTWFAGDPPPATTPRDPNWITVPRADLARPFATDADQRVGRVRAGMDLHADPALAALSGAERVHLSRRGLGQFVEYLGKRVDRADDLTDYGFARIQTDVYRVRHMMLGASDATRLAVSPTLASIARTDSAVAAQGQIAEYLQEVKKAAPSIRVPKLNLAAAAGAGDPFEAASFAAAMGGTTAFRTAAAAATTAAAGGTAAAATTVKATTSAATLVRSQTVAKTLRFSAAPPEVVLAAPILGATPVRTTAIAKRLVDPVSLEARNYALATRQDAVGSLVRLMQEFAEQDGSSDSGLFADVLVYGLVVAHPATGATVRDPFLVAHEESEPPDNRPAWRERARPLADFIKFPDLLAELIKPVEVGTPDEAALFSQVSDLSDNTVALLRQFEARVKLYRDALGRCEDALEVLRQDYNRTLARLHAANERLAEARHDVGVARALLAEEQARIDAINERRSRVLAEEVRFLAFMRPRESMHVLQPPARTVDPALAEAPVPACLRDHHDVPDELEEMLRVVREAPAGWFVKVPALLDRLDRPELLLRTVQTAQLRAPLLLQHVVAPPAPVGRVAATVAQVLARQAPLLQARASAAAALNLQVLATTTWQGVRAQAREAVSLGDLIDGGHGKSDVARRAADEFNRIGAVCTCLHAEFSGVLPSLRLDWAELMSQFDDAPNLRNLASLPRWGEIGSVDRRQMQAYVDFLFAQIEPGQTQAEALVNDVVRMCLLLASHAPVGRIVAGRLPRPVNGVRPGLRIPLVALEPTRLRVGMQALVYRNDAVVARATVEDVGGAEVSARVLHVAAGVQDLGTDVRVHFDHAAVVSAAAARAGSLVRL